MLKNPIREMIDWLKRPDPREEVMQRRFKEAAELRKRYDYLQEEIRKKDMITLDEFIGFPVPKEHREELWKRLCSYSAMTKKELMSLLLQYDWELLQLKLQTQEDMHKILSQKSSMPVGEKIETAINATHSVKVIAEMKREPFDMCGDEKKSIVPGVPVKSPVVVAMTQEELIAERDKKGLSSEFLKNKLF